jgi:hypothetical protein
VLHLSRRGPGRAFSTCADLSQQQPYRPRGGGHKGSQATLRGRGGGQRQANLSSAHLRLGSCAAVPTEPPCATRLHNYTKVDDLTARESGDWGTRQEFLRQLLKVYGRSVFRKAVFREEFSELWLSSMRPSAFCATYRRVRPNVAHGYVRWPVTDSGRSRPTAGSREILTSCVHGSVQPVQSSQPLYGN